MYPYILQKNENEEVTVGNLIALMVDAGEDWKDVSVPADERATGSGAAVPIASSQSSTSISNVSSSTRP